MKAFIFTRGTHKGRLRAHRLMAAMGFNYTIVVNNMQGVDNLQSWHPELDGTRIVTPNIDNFESTAFHEMLEYVRRYFVGMDEWYLRCNDNVDTIGILGEAPMVNDEKIDYESMSSREWRDAFLRVASPKEIAGMVYELHRKAVEQGTSVAGIGGIANPMFKKKRWADMRLVRGDFMLCRNDGVPWIRDGLLEYEDFCMSFEALKRYGSTVTNRWAQVIKEEYEPGGATPTGVGGKEAGVIRDQYRIPSVKFLEHTFPGLAVASPGKPMCVEVAVKSRKQLETWRENHHVD